MKENRIIPFRLTEKISEFDVALFEDINSDLQDQRKVILPTENVFGYTHGTKWHTKIAEDVNYDEVGEMQLHSSEITVPFQDIINNDLGVLIRYRNSIVSGLMQEFMRSMYQTVNEATEKTGNVVNAKGGGFTAEQFLEMLEKIEFGVDREGKVSLPQIHAGPELTEKILQELSSQGPEFEKKVQEIMKRKSDAAVEREKDRKSRFPKQKG